MAGLFPVAGSRMYVGTTEKATALTPWVESDFAGVSWVEIDGWSNMGGLGDTAEVIRTALINRDRVVKQKGSADAGSMQNQYAAITDDPGQLALIAANSTKNEYPFRLVWDDKPTVTSPATSTATTMYFTGLVNGARYVGGQANTIHMFESTIEINSNIVVVPKEIVS